MGSPEKDETERKYDVGAATVFPNLAETAGVDSVGQPEAFILEAVYFDTPRLDLARNGVTLRRRTGGHDEGWHLKLPAGPDTRTELHEPLGSERTVPEAFRARVHSIARGRMLEQVATVRTERREYPLRDAASRVLAVATDDDVRAQRLGGGGEEMVWREWEVELDQGPRALLDAIGARLLDAGASPAAASSKLARVLGEPPTARAARNPAVDKKVGKGKPTVQQLLTAQLAQHQARLLDQDAGVRADHPEAVHRVRIAARRLRSVLTTFRPVLESSATDPVREELRWLGERFAQARDAQVLREHLHTVLASEPVELVIGPVGARLDDELSAAYTTGRDAATSALDSDRYMRLLDAIDELIASPPLSSLGDRSAKKMLPGLLARDVRRLKRAVRAIEGAGDAAERDAAFHEARKKAKRLRYAAESAIPVLGKRARSLATGTKALQETLGIHQDTVVSRARLRDYGMQAHLDGTNAFTFGRLHALEQARAERAEADFSGRWAILRDKELKRWA